jgi:hypothetical protein
MNGRIQSEAEEERMSDIEVPEYSEEENDTGLGAGRRKTDFDVDDKALNRKSDKESDFRHHQNHRKPIARTRSRNEGSINRRTQT